MASSEAQEVNDKASARVTLRCKEALHAEARASWVSKRYLHRTVAENLVICRQTCRVSQEVFAGVLGVHRTYAGGLERGEHNLTLKTIERLADRLGLHGLELLLPADGQFKLAIESAREADSRRAQYDAIGGRCSAVASASALGGGG